MTAVGVCSSLLKKRTLENTQQKDDDTGKLKKKKKAKHDVRGNDSKKFKKHKKHLVAQR